ncbi:MULTISPECIES: hypothetical protein [unclassified Gilliamella]|uniref:hypothetical protein n=1 Tax=unclassified Gilliamella TaxID=2685620 RepID=UPI00226A5A1B|nr:MULTISPECIES: hypothetical protein [unclassified Gilliamella]MCX8596217.1 hypothetical protein [Gilliamella sp. B3493]MCX8598584.1 hypothetical protein [Gilliamella sp. B3486]MCX8689408.1 hypothetical protein [Gilliamella sp. B2973]MCX8705110.1 hypothetical protein [Gilliamella sp. B3127]
MRSLVFSIMIRESQTCYQNIMRGRSFNLVMNLFRKGFADDAVKAFYKELYIKLAKAGTKSGKQYVDSFVEGIGIIERKATDLSNVYKKTAESYIRDAAKYKNTVSNELGNLGDKVYLHVDNMKVYRKIF